jgi:hypothetical protein
MIMYMSSPSRRQKILSITLFTMLLPLLFDSCLATMPYKYTYELLDMSGGSATYRLTVSVSEELYENYSSRDHTLYYYDFSRFVTPDALKPIAEDLRSIYKSDEDFANGVLTLVHQIPYVESDPEKYPVETIVDNQGDCDLLSTTAASIMKAGGLDVVILFLELHNHVFLGVNLPEGPKDARSTVHFYRTQEKKYYIAETTGGNWETGWRVGECPENLRCAIAKVIHLDNYEKEAPEQVSSSYTIPDSSELQMLLSSSFAVSQNDIEISGTLSPSMAGENVTLLFSALGSPLTLLATVVTDFEGEYSHIWHSPPSGLYSLIAEWPGDDDYNSAASGKFTLIIIPSELLIIGILLILLVVILVVVNLATRGITLKQETIEDWELD